MLILSIQEVLKSSHIGLTQLESIVGKCRSMAIAVRCAILYMRVQYPELARAFSLERNFQWNRRNVEIDISQQQLRVESSVILAGFETSDVEWRTLGRDLSNWSHLHSHKAHIDTSSRRWGGMLVASSKEFKVEEDFNDEEVAFHINEKETLAFYRFL